MLLAEDQLPNYDDLVIIRNLPSTLGWITSFTEHMASEDLGYTILHCINSPANDLIGFIHPCSFTTIIPFHIAFSYSVHALP